MQNILAMLLAKSIPSIAMVVFGIKELYMATIMLLMVILILANGKFHKELIIPLCIILYLFVISIFASPYFNLMSLRQALIIPFFFIFGFFFVNKIEINKFANLVFKFYIIIVLLGLFERFVLYTEDESFFYMWGVREWANMKGWGYELPRSWYSTDLSSWTVERIRRIPGLLIGDAVSFGQMLVFPLILAVINKKYFIAIIVVIALVFSLSKGGILATFVGLSLFFIYEKKFSQGTRYILFGISALTVGIFIYIILGYLTQMSSVMLHFNGFYTNFMNLFDNPFGNGVGSGGNFARRFGYSEIPDAFGIATQRISDFSVIARGESFLGTMLSQFGIFGLFMYFYYPIRLFKTQLRKDQTFLQGIKYTVLGLFAVGFFSEAAFTYIGTGFIVALIPLVIMGNRSNNTSTPLLYKQ